MGQSLNNHVKMGGHFSEDMSLENGDKKDDKPFVDASVAFAEVISTLVSSGGFIELELVASLVSRYNISFRL